MQLSLRDAELCARTAAMFVWFVAMVSPGLHGTCFSYYIRCFVLL